VVTEPRTVRKLQRKTKSLFEKWSFGRASVPASPNFSFFPMIFGLAGTLALPGLSFQTRSKDLLAAAFERSIVYLR